VAGVEWFHQYAIRSGLTGKDQLFEGIGKDENPASPFRKVAFRGEQRELSGVDVEIQHENVDLIGAIYVERLTAVDGKTDFAVLR
jgi:hypothetical protein